VRVRIPVRLRIGLAERAPVIPDLTPAGAATWQDPVWGGVALQWAADRLAERGLVLDGEPEQRHVRAWSTAFRLSVRGGAVWLKSVGPGSAQEPALVGALGEWVPEHVLTPLAVDRGRRLMLLLDGGLTLREAGRASSAAAWEAMLGDYARLQVELVPHADDMVTLAVPDLRPDRLPDLAAAFLADDGWLMTGRPGGLAAEQRVRLLAGLGHYRELCGRLTDGGVPATLQHDDLHDANVFVGTRRHRFFDWGDASVAQPGRAPRAGGRRPAGRPAPAGDDLAPDPARCAPRRASRMARRRPRMGRGVPRTGHPHRA
jgi:hypothetical protein